MSPTCKSRQTATWREPKNQSHLRINLPQPAQPERAKQANLKAAYSPKRKAQEEVVHSNQSTTRTKQKNITQLTATTKQIQKKITTTNTPKNTKKRLAVTKIINLFPFSLHQPRQTSIKTLWKGLKFICPFRILHKSDIK
jgi:hypothetical protein